MAFTEIFKAGLPLSARRYNWTLTLAISKKRCKMFFLQISVDAIYDAEIAFPNPDKSTMAYLLNRGAVDVHINLR